MGNGVPYHLTPIFRLEVTISEAVGNLVGVDKI